MNTINVNCWKEKIKKKRQIQLFGITGVTSTHIHSPDLSQQPTPCRSTTISCTNRTTELIMTWSEMVKPMMPEVHACIICFTCSPHVDLPRLATYCYLHSSNEFSRTFCEPRCQFYQVTDHAWWLEIWIGPGDQMARLFFIFWPFYKMKNCPKAQKLAKLGSKFCQIQNIT